MLVNSWKSGLVILLAIWSLTGCGFFSSSSSSSSSSSVSPAVVPPVFVPVNPSLPVITAPNLTVSGGTGAGGAFVSGDTVTLVWNDSSTGINNNAGVNIVGVTVDFTNFGGGSVTATNSGSIWTTVFTIPISFTFGANNGVLISAIDSSGNVYTYIDLLPVVSAVPSSSVAVSPAPSSGVVLPPVPSSGVGVPPVISSPAPVFSATKQISFLGEQMIVNLMYFGCFLWGCLVSWAIVAGISAN